MTIKVYTLPSNNSSRKVIKYLEENNINYKEYRMNKTRLTWNQYLEILVGTENGIEDIVSTNSKVYKELVSKGMNFDALTLSQLYETVLAYPTLMKAPIIYAKYTTLVGYNADEMSLLQKREVKQSLFLSSLKEARKNEEVNGVYVASHTKYDWGTWK